MENSILWTQQFTTDQLIDEKFWNYDIGDGSAYGIPGWGNQEREYYTNVNTRFDERGLLIVAEKTDPADGALPTYYGERAEWVSSKITTKDKVHFHYGAFTVRAKLPLGDGAWPAVWMLGTDIAEVTWPQCGEIDIIELRGDRPRNAFFTLHGPGYFGDNGSGAELDTGIDLTADFHEYRIEWLPGEITWKLDGRIQQVRTKSDVEPNEWVFDKPFYLIMNLAMGGNFTGGIDPELDCAELVISEIKFEKINGVGSVHLH